MKSKFPCIRSKLESYHQVLKQNVAFSKLVVPVTWFMRLQVQYQINADEKVVSPESQTFDKAYSKQFQCLVNLEDSATRNSEITNGPLFKIYFLFSRRCQSYSF